MRTLGNIIWFLCAGLWSWLSWTLVGLQCIKLAVISLFPFGAKIYSIA